METLLVQYRDGEAIKAIAAHIRTYQGSYASDKKLFEELLVSQKARALLCKRNVLSNPELFKLVRVLDILIFDKEMKESKVD